MGTMGAGVTFGITSWKSVCRDCGYQGEPLLFDSQEAYRNFLKGLVQDTGEHLQEAPAEEIKENASPPSEEEKEMEGFLHELHDQEDELIQQPVQEESFKKDKVWWPEIVLAVIISAVGILFSINSFISAYSTLGAVFYGILLFIILAFFILFIIVIIEYFARSIMRLVNK